MTAGRKEHQDCVPPPGYARADNSATARVRVLGALICLGRPDVHDVEHCHRRLGRDESELLAEHCVDRRVQAVVDERRAIKKAARQELKRKLRNELSEEN